jgi:hypothetical protein
VASCQESKEVPPGGAPPGGAAQGAEHRVQQALDFSRVLCEDRGMRPVQVPQKLPVLAAQFRFDLRRESFRQPPQGIGPRHHGLAQVQKLGGQLLKMQGSSHLLFHPGLEPGRLCAHRGISWPRLLRVERRGHRVGEADYDVGQGAQRVVNLLLALRGDSDSRDHNLTPGPGDFDRVAQIGANLVEGGQDAKLVPQGS